MSAADTVAGLAAFARRRAGTDAERRAAAWLAAQLTSPRRSARVEPFWCRPDWALAQAWHVALALAGSVLTVSDPIAGGIVAIVALACVVLDATTGRSPGRRLTPERASQNVVSEPAAPEPGPAATADDAACPLLLVTAPYDAGRCGLVHHRAVRRLGARARRLSLDGRLTPGWLGWIAIAIGWLVAVAVSRRLGVGSELAAIAQIPPTVGLLAALFALVQLALAPVGPAAGDPGSAAAVAIALVRALDAAPPARLRVGLLLQGASDGPRAGLRHHLAANRAPLRAQTTIVLGIGAAGAGEPRWCHSDGPLLALRSRARLRSAAAAVAAADPRLHAGPHRSRGTAPAFAAQLAGLPALSIGALDTSGLVPRSHRPDDAPARVDPSSMDRLLAFALALVDTLDAELPAGATSDLRSGVAAQ